MKNTSLLKTIIHHYRKYQDLGERAMAQLTEAQLFLKPFAGDTDIAIIVSHLSGNMLSRWTDFLTTDGEKEWRHRDREFEPLLTSRQAVMEAWEKGWGCLFKAVEPLTPEDLDRTVTIRAQPHRVEEALIRNLTHTAYHIGQIVFLAKSIKGEEWESLSIPKGQSEAFLAAFKRRFS